MRSAYELGYHVYTLKDCCAASSMAAQEVSTDFTEKIRKNLPFCAGFSSSHNIFRSFHLLVPMLSYPQAALEHNFGMFSVPTTSEEIKNSLAETSVAA